MRRHILTLLLLLGLGLAPAAAQDSNILLPADSVEALLERGGFDVIDRRASRGLKGERTDRVVLSYSDGTLLPAKWAVAPGGGEAFNNNPRFEAAAYEVQKLFLDDDAYMVPPTVLRAFSTREYEEHDPGSYVRPTLRGTESVLVVLQYWLFNVTPDDFWDRDRFEADTLYARHFANFNIGTYLMRHGDENEGNFLISITPGSPRVFSVDNGVAFSSKESDRGFRWRRLQIDRVSAATVARLRVLTREEVTRQLETLAEFRVLEDGTLAPVAATANLDPGDGIRQREGRVQLGLTRREIDGVWDRIQDLLEDVDDGDLEVF